MSKFTFERKVTMVVSHAGFENWNKPELHDVHFENPNYKSYRKENMTMAVLQAYPDYSGKGIRMHPDDEDITEIVDKVLGSMFDETIKQKQKAGDVRSYSELLKAEILEHEEAGSWYLSGAPRGIRVFLTGSNAKQYVAKFRSR